jgi:hypothetical protein
LKKGRA